MRSDIWGLLGINPTADRKAIRSAYAAQSRLHHPEEEPEYFVELSQAYKQALDFAGTADTEVKSKENQRGRENKSSAANREDRNIADDKYVEKNRKAKEDRNRENRKAARDTVDKENQEDEGSSESVKSNDTESGRIHSGAGDEEKEAEASLLERLADAQEKAIQESMETGTLHEFISLFTNFKQAKNADTWRRFFLSEAFLGEQYSEEFAKGLYAYLMGQEICPSDNLPMALLQELAIAYALIPHFAGEEYKEGMKYPKEWYKVSVEQTFPARKQVAEIFNRQGWDCDLKSMTRRMMKQPANKVRHNAFSDYLNLKEMGLRGELTETEKEEWQHILNFGQVHYLYERNGKRLGGTDCESRSDCVVKLYVQWLKDERLPECVLKFLYQRFSLRELEHSSTKGLYGALKEQVLRQLPQVEELLFGQDGLEQKVIKVYRLCSRIINDNQNNYEKSIYEETPQIKEQVEALFAMPEWGQLRQDRGMFDKLYGGAKRLVMPRSLTEGLIRYLQQGDFPEPKRTELLESLLRSLNIGRMCKEIDYRFQILVPEVDMDDLEGNGDFWQYYLMRGYGFRHSRIRGAWEDGYLYEMDGECYLPAYIRYLYAPSRVWQRTFTGFNQETESILEPVSALCDLPDGKALRVEFHYHYCLYFVEEEPVLTPVLSFGQLRQWATEHSGAGRVRDFFFLLAVTAIEDSERTEAEEMIMQWLEKLPLYPQTCPLLARLLAADNDRLPAGTKTVCYEEQERFCFRAVVSGEGIRILRQVEFGWEDGIFRRAEFGWKEVPLPLEVLGLGGSRVSASDFAKSEKLAQESLLLLRQPRPVPLAVRNLEGMDSLQKTQAVLKAMGFPERVEGYCVLRYGQKRERRHDKVFYGALSPFGFPIGIHSAEYERSMRFHMDVSQRKIKEGKRYVGRFGWGFKYSLKSDFWPLCVYQGDSGMYYADGTIRMYRAQSLDRLLADWLEPELEGVTEVEVYGELLTVSRLDHRLEYCYGEKDFLDSVHGTGQTVTDFFTVFGGYRVWETFARWMDAALGRGLPDWVNVLIIGQALGNEEGEGSTLSLTGSYVEEVNLDLPKLQERLWAEDTRDDFQGGEEREKLSEYKEYPLETSYLAWGKGLAVHLQRQSLRDAVWWYLEERPGEGAQMMKKRRIRVEIIDVSV